MATQSPPRRSCWSGFKEWLLPSDTFSRSDTPKQDLYYGRWLVAIFYLGLTGVLIYTFVWLFYAGRVELMSQQYKVDFIEAPSMAFCPFNQGDEIQWPRYAQPYVKVNKVEMKGRKDLSIQVKNCTFDRSCACIDMHKYALSDVGKTEHQHGGSNMPMVFREHIEFRTNLTDPSPERILRVGIYDSGDDAPDWFYVNQGGFCMGQLELMIWTVVDVSIAGLLRTLKGDLRAMMKNRHIFRYTSQQVGNPSLHRHWDETAVRYEMKTFFVEESVSSQHALSLYTLGWILAILAIRWVIVEAFFTAFMPEWSEKDESEKPPVRRLTGVSLSVRKLLCCCKREDSTDGEDEPLLEGKDKSSSASA